jgi:hypothetical protein
MKRQIIHQQLSYRITGCFYKTQNSLGRFRKEKSYADFLENILKENDLKYKREIPLLPFFSSEKPKKKYSGFYY